jgi:hypothetical protein
MTALLTLTRREIVERRPLLWGVLAAALLPLLARLQPWLRPELRRDWHEGLALIFGITFPIAIAIGLGASVVGEDLAERRLGFYFSRPLNGWTIWASKNLAAILITLATVAAFVLPVGLLSDVRPSAMLGDLVRKFPEWFPPWILVLLGLIFVAQAVAGAYRARDGLFALDIAALATLVSLGAALVWRLRAAGVSFFSPGVPSTLTGLVKPAMLVVAAIAAVAAAMQVIVGRTDARRGHLALSTTLWGTLATGLLCLAGFVSWDLSVTPRDVGADPWTVRATPSASHLIFWAAHSRGLGYQPWFLLDTRTGGFDRLPPSRMLGLAFSRDGSRAVWLEGGEGELPVLVLRRLDASGSTIRSNLDRYAGFNPLFAELSDDGRHAVLGMQGRIAVVDTDSGREAASVTGDQLGVDPRNSVPFAHYAFVGDSVVGFFTAPPTAGLPLVTSTFNFRTGRVDSGPRALGIDSVRTVRDGRALASGRNGSLVVVDGSTVLELLPASGAVVGSATLLEDGRAAAFVKREGDPRLLVWDREGRTAVDVPFPAGSSVVAGEPRVGWLALGPGTDYSKPPRTVFVDSTTGAVVRVEEGLTPIGHSFDDSTLPVGSPGSQLFVGSKGEIVRLDPDTGRRDAVFVSNAPEAAR